MSRLWVDLVDGCSLGYTVVASKENDKTKERKSKEGNVKREWVEPPANNNRLNETEEKGDGAKGAGDWMASPFSTIPFQPWHLLRKTPHLL